ncbi:bifunctional methylenetetrahydrofolate dehydrogenase/cyclohydrolase, mitochondrial [Chelonus insularis]|uniref:bifunctional methylenetetrahydrofolate dehydrogenase/cyclohydrolase, mitochondrial n=1 Tax=Chelonus insularis TaxID=460826 RepID=UPI00158A69CB|nr:bifunctional methylenetetrahydrofolate dehydrogenase/cyclohydrolase, mitochondrial [Chelonus insularis]
MTTVKFLKVFFNLPSRQIHSSNIRNEAVIISGKQIAQEIKNDLKGVVDSWIASGKKRPRLVAILVGNDPASEVYVGRKVKAATSVGIHAETIYLNENIKQEDLIQRIQNLNKDPDVDGILVQLPLPKGFNEKEACHTVLPHKDVDGFHSENLGKLSTDSEGFVPATALAVRELILRSGVKTMGRNAVVIGRSKHVGLPTALLLHANGKGDTRALDMTTTICHIHTPREELIKFSRLADVLVSATGVPGLVTKDMIKPGACVIDVGITRVDTPDGKTKIVGDVDYEQVKQVAGFITPVPGGVGPMTVAMLMKNTFWAAEKNYQMKNSL